MTNTQTEQQRTAFRQSMIAGKARHIAELNGGTGDLRRTLSDKEVAKLKAGRRMAKASRKGNR